MERIFQGDLADIFRSGVSDHWNNNYYFDQSDQETQMIQKSTRIIHDQGFSQPFTSLLADPLIHQGASSPSLFGTTRILPMEFDGHNNNQNHDNNNIFSKMLQITPNAANSSLSSSSEIITSSSNSSSSKRCWPEASTSSLQISSAARNPGIKRRRNQTKKVVCIPAPTPANSRSTGEVVPSDLWAWRKYGQKPIKGSPYPRGYYRCSSSKGCLARKQVERSRTDPNMLVITYTSEHNHPWPTQRNALAGSTRTPQQPKTATTERPPQKETIKDEGPPLKESVVQVKDELQVLEGSFPQGYRPEFPEHHGDHGQQEDYFSGLDDIEVDPINMLLNNGFLGGDEEQ